jgi:hypothetical protein
MEFAVTDVDAVIADLQHQLDDLTRAVSAQQATIDRLVELVEQLGGDSARH